MTNMTFVGLWQGTHAAVRRDFAAFMTLAAAFIALPALALNIAMPDMTNIAAIGSRPALPAGLLPLLFLVMLAQIVGLFSNSAVTADPDSGGDRTFAAIMRSALPGVLRFAGAIILLYIVTLVATVVVFIVGALIALAMGLFERGASPPPSVGTILGWAIAACLLVLPIIVWLQARLSPMVGVYLREQGGVIAGICRAWGLSRGHAGPIAGMLLVYLAMAMAIMLVALVLSIGLAMRHPVMIVVLPIVMAVPGLFLNVYSGALLGVIYRQLDDQSSGMRGAVSVG